MDKKWKLVIYLQWQRRKGVDGTMVWAPADLTNRHARASRGNLRLLKYLAQDVVGSDPNTD